MRTAAGVLFLIAGCSPDREPPPRSQVVHWTASAAAERREANGDAIVDVELKAHVDDGWKMYSLGQQGGGPVPMSVRVDSSAPYTIAGSIAGPSALREVDPNFGIETETYSGDAAFRFALRVPAAVDSTAPLEVKVRSQACSDKLCLPARTTTVAIERKTNPR